MVDSTLESHGGLGESNRGATHLAALSQTSMRFHREGQNKQLSR